MARRLTVLLKGYPRLSETFIAQELLSLERRGLTLTLVSLRHPTDRHTHPIHQKIRAKILYLPEYLIREPGRVIRGWWRARRYSGYSAARLLWLRDMRRNPTANRVRRWGQALVLAAEMAPETPHLHAHFLHTPSSVARYAARICGLPWSFSAHAKDIWITPEWEKREKLADCAWGVTCTEYGRAHLDDLVPGKTWLSYHGLDPSLLPKTAPEYPAGDGQTEHETARDETAGDGTARDGTAPDDPVRFLSVGRAVPKKGFDILLHALARLPQDMAWHWTHIGGGAGLDALRRTAERLGMAERITWRGAAAQDAVFEAYRAADLFILASTIARDGDRDGLPNVLMEAASQGLCSVASAVAAIPELLRHRETGWLVPPGDPEALARAIDTLARDPAQRRTLAAAARRRVHDHFDHETGLAVLAERLGLEPPDVRSPEGGPTEAAPARAEAETRA